MSIALGPTPPVRMRSSLTRVVLSALCVLLLVMAMIRSDAMPSRPKLFGKSGVKAHRGQNQKSLDDPNSPVRSDSMLGDDSMNPDAYSSHLNCSADMPRLQELKQKYNLGEKFHYMKRHVRFTRTKGLERKRMTTVNQSFLQGNFRTVDTRADYDEAACDAPLEFQVSASDFPYTVNASDYMFGVSTTFKRFMNPSTTPINEWIYWLTDSHGNSNGGKLVLMLLDASDDELQEVANLLGDVGIDVEVYHSDSSLEMAVRYFSLIPTLYTHPEAKKKKWLVTCDDDTFFPNMHGLLEKMETHDHTREMYIGTLSEDIQAIERHGSQAFGGGGVFLSLPLAEKLTELFSSCTTEQKIHEANSGWGPQGDIILHNCIYENTETRLTTFWDLWQLDIIGSASGFYEWGIKPLSLHHYRGGSWHKAKPATYAKVAYACGEDCTFQRFQTKDDYILSGYSISHYPEGVTFDTNQAEGTFRAIPENKGWNLDFKVGPQRPSLEKTGRKMSWDMEESEMQSDGSILQTYIRKQNDERWVNPDGEPMSNIDGVIELVWFPA